jgi:Rab-like protein 5
VRQYRKLYKNRNNYRPTAGTRILEVEKDAPKNPKRPG